MVAGLDPLVMPPRPTCRTCGAPRTVQGWSTPERLAWLRATVPAAERALVGWPAIQATLAAWGVVTRERYAPTVRTLEEWRRRRRFPVAPLPRGPVWTTTFAVVAWLLGPAYVPLGDRRADGTLLPQAKARDPSAPDGWRRVQPWRPRASSASAAPEALGASDGPTP